MQFLQKKCVQGKLIDLFEIKSNELLTFSNFLGNLRASWLYGDFKLDCVITQRYVLLFLSFQIRTQSEIQKVGKHLFPYQTHSRIKPMAGLLSILLSFSIELQNSFVVYPVQKQWCGCVPVLVFSCGPLEIVRSTNFEEHLRTTASVRFYSLLFLDINYS